MKYFTPSVGKKAAIIIFVLVAAFTAKDFYRSADYDSLEWLLTPTALLAERISGIAFDQEPGMGWVNRDNGVTIAPSCSGMNYLIILFCMSSLFALTKLKSMRALSCWVVFSVLSSYGLTLIVNSLRIWLAIVLYNADIYSSSLTVESVHRIAGVSVYYFFMVFYYLAVSFILTLTVGGMAVSGSEGIQSQAAGGTVVAALLLPVLYRCCALSQGGSVRPVFLGTCSGGYRGKCRPDDPSWSGIGGLRCDGKKTLEFPCRKNA